MSSHILIILCIVAIIIESTNGGCDFDKRWFRGDCGDQNEVGWPIGDIKTHLSETWIKDIEKHTSKIKTQTTNDIYSLRSNLNDYKNDCQNKIAVLQSENTAAKAKLKASEEIFNNYKNAQDTLIAKIMADMVEMTTSYNNTITDLKEKINRIIQESDEQKASELAKKKIIGKRLIENNLI